MSQPVAADTNNSPGLTSASRQHRPIWLIGLLLAVMLTVIVGGTWWYRNWCRQQTKQFASRCRLLRTSNDWDKLAKTSKTWHEWDLRNADAILFQAEAAQGQGQFLDAARLLGEVPEGSPKRLPALVEQSSLLFGAANHPLEGIRVCQQILKLEPRAYLPHQRLIFFYALTFQHENLLSQIRSSMRLQCEPIEAYVYLMLADDLSFSNGFELNNRWLSRDPTQEMFLVARTIHRWKHLTQDPSQTNDSKQQIALAEQLLTDYLKRFPENVAVRVFFLDRALVRGDLDSAAELLANFPSQFQGDSRYWRYRGWLSAAHDELELAETAYREAIQRFPLGWMARHELADVLRRRRSFQDVNTNQQLALQGKEIRQEILKIPDARAIAPGLLDKVARYALACNDDLVATSIRRRLNQTK